MSPEWFSHQSWGSTVTCQLSSYRDSSEFLDFCLCAIIASYSFSHSLQVKCTYHFRNEHGDSHDLYCYLHEEDERRIDSDHVLVGFDPCLVAKKKDMFSEYSEVSIEFQPVETFCKFERLLLDRCQVVECGVRLLHANDGLEEQCSKAREHINNYFDKILMDEMESISFRDNFNILLFC